MKKAIFMDLDGTLLPMVEKDFVEGYFSLLVKKLLPYGADKDKVIAAIWTGTKAMARNDGQKTNKEVFWNCYRQLNMPEHLIDKIDEFYNTDFYKAEVFCGKNENIKEFMDYINKKFQIRVLATNPIFPQKATQIRLSWIGLSEEDFDFVTYYENFNYAKPNPTYYLKLLEKYNLKPEEVIMIGNNDVEDYKAAMSAGIETIIVEDTRIINEEVDVKNKCYFKDLIDKIEELL